MKQSSVKLTRTNKGYAPQSEFAAEMGVACATIQRWEKGKKSPNKLPVAHTGDNNRKCETCTYRGYLKRDNETVYCDYLTKTGSLRPCSIDNCFVYIQCKKIKAGVS